MKLHLIGDVLSALFWLYFFYESRIYLALWTSLFFALSSLTLLFPVAKDISLVLTTSYCVIILIAYATKYRKVLLSGDTTSIKGALLIDRIADLKRDRKKITRLAVITTGLLIIMLGASFLLNVK